MNNVATMIADFGTPAIAAISVIAGLALGIAYFKALRISVDAFGVDARPRSIAFLSLLRIAACGIAFGLAAQAGAVSLLAMFGGFLLVRTAVLISNRKHP
ncbi:MAG: hypothetical protein KDE14_00805 [Rhodobacteraceae bacterium]|nr:hypothetical protein [Paracoccaceae bacterium]